MATWPERLLDKFTFSVFQTSKLDNSLLYGLSGEKSNTVASSLTYTHYRKQLHNLAIDFFSIVPLTLRILLGSYTVGGWMKPLNFTMIQIMQDSFLQVKIYIPI